MVRRINGKPSGTIVWPRHRHEAGIESCNGLEAPIWNRDSDETHSNSQ
jgi:hypothetical protein